MSVLVPASCSMTFTPTDSQIKALERALEGNSCIGNPADWDRTYWIDPSDPEKLKFSLGKPLTKWSRGREIVTTRRWRDLRVINDAPYAASGHFDLKSNEVTTAFCGSNE